MAKVLFICNQGKNRSKKAAELLAKQGFEAKSCGIGKLSINPVTKNMIEWADILVVMDKDVEKALIKKYKQACSSKKILNFEIPDIYDYDSSSLAEVLKEKIILLRNL